MNSVCRRKLWPSLLLLAGVMLFARGGPADAAEKAAAKLDSAALARLIDQHIGQRLTQEQVTRAPLADDAEFLRRVYLDLVGVIPPADKAAAFLDSTDPAKRARLIDELLASPQYGRHLADIWEELLLERDSSNRRLQMEPLPTWLAKQFNANRPWDQIVHELLTVTGTQEQNGANTFFIANRTPDKLTDIVARVFAGVQLQCAQCHNHPWASWKRADYWGMAQFFTKVRAGGKKVGKGDPEVVNEIGVGKGLPLPESALKVPPKFLGGAEPRIDANRPYRPVLAQWLTSPDNPYFARAMVNRTWAQLFGRGLVHPVDDIHDQNPASHPELFAALAREFAASGFDLKHLIRGICNSETYQRASDGKSKTAGGSPLFNHMTVKPLTPQQLHDSLKVVLGSGEESRRTKAGKKALVPGTRAEFIAFFRAAEGADPTEYPAGIPQVLRLMNSSVLNDGTALLNKVVRPGRSPVQTIERLYLTTLSRRPTAAESQRLVTFVQDAGSATRQAYADVLWVLLNSSEFSLNH
ncbi:MAG TPA: DUF1549 and DUF1553 domain-containing protein [Gemmataceae bacterium]|nr:DUF1549 and DUF1553 domain-containing protein [Gemmataceae bacterium]